MIKHIGDQWNKENRLGRMPSLKKAARFALSASTVAWLGLWPSCAESWLPFEGVEMTINTTPKKMPAGDGNPTAGSTINDLDCCTARREEKEFSTLRAEFALKGHALHRTDPAAGPVTYWAERWGLVRYLPSTSDARLFLEQIGGRP